MRESLFSATKHKQTILLAGLLLALLVPRRGVGPFGTTPLLAPSSGWAQGTPPSDDDPPGGYEQQPGPIESLIRHILVFPVEAMQEATEKLLLNILGRNAEGIKDLFSGLVGDLTLQNPGIKEPSNSVMWRGVDVFAPTWRFTVKIAVALWPATLAIMVATAAKEAAISTSWGIAGLKEALAQWVTGVLACAFSLEILDLANRLSNAIILGVVALPIRGAGGLNVETIVDALLGTALRVLGMTVSPFAAIVAVLILLVLGLALVISIVGQYFARVALLYIVVALAPVVLVLGILHPARWLQWLWVKGVLLVMLLGPITALLFKLALALHTAVVNPILSFLMVVGVISVLLSVNGAIIKGVFGAATEVIGKSLETVKGVTQGIATAGLAIGAAALTGGASLGVLPAGLGAGGGGAATAGAGASGAVGAATGVRGAAVGVGSAIAGAGGAAADVNSAAAGRTATPASTEGNEAQAGEETTAAAEGGGAEAGGEVGQPGFLGKVQERWNEAKPHERTEAMGAAMRGAGRILGPGSLAGRTMEAVGGGLQAGARQLQGGQGSQQAGGGQSVPSPSYASTGLAALSPAERQGYQEAMQDVRRDLQGPMQAAGLDLGRVERDAMAPVWAAAQHDTLTNVARQAGFGDREDTQSMVSDFVASRVEGQLRNQGFLDELITRPGEPPNTPLSDTPALLDYERGQQMAWAAGGDMSTYAGLHHALRRYADSPQKGTKAAAGFYGAMMEARGAGPVEAARSYAAQAGVPNERLELWLQQL